jgi:hypothetical protein
MAPRPIGLGCGIPLDISTFWESETSLKAQLESDSLQKAHRAVLLGRRDTRNCDPYRSTHVGGSGNPKNRGIASPLGKTVPVHHPSPGPRKGK